MKLKKVVSVALVAALSVGLLAGCGGGKDEKDMTITVAASPSPHAEILEVAKEVLAEEGYTLEVKEFTDYVQPNLALDSGDLDANYFQHLPYLEGFNKDEGTDLVSIGAVHYEPMGIYAAEEIDLASVPEGAKVGIPVDPTNGGRALLLLEANGLIKLNPEAGIAATKLDIVENPLNLEIVDMEAAQLAKSLGDLDLAVINGNYALLNGLSIDQALAIEAADSLAAETYGNIVAVKAGNENAPGMAELMEVLKGETVATFIKETYAGSVATMN